MFLGFVIKRLDVGKWKVKFWILGKKRVVEVVSKHTYLLFVQQNRGTLE